MNIYVYELRQYYPFAVEGPSTSIIVRVVKAKNRKRADELLCERGYRSYLKSGYGGHQSAMVTEVKSDEEERVIY